LPVESDIDSCRAVCADRTVLEPSDPGHRGVRQKTTHGCSGRAGLPGSQFVRWSLCGHWGWRSAGFGVAACVLAVRRFVRWAEIRLGVGVGVVQFCAWSRVVPVVRDRICSKAAPQTASWKTCSTCFPRCRNPRAPHLRVARGQRLSRCRPHHRSVPRASAPILVWRRPRPCPPDFPGAGTAARFGRSDGQTGSGRRGVRGRRIYRGRSETISRARLRPTDAAEEPVIHRFLHRSELSVEKFSLQSEPGRILSG
jgi:hypothetical protein